MIFTVGNGGNFILNNDKALTIIGGVTLSNSGGAVGDASLTIAGTGNGITTSTVEGSEGSITAANLTVDTQAAASLTGLNLTGNVSGTVKGCGEFGR